MEYYFEHPVITGIVPVDNKELIEQLNNMELKVGLEIKFKNTPPVYIKSIEDGMVILSKDKGELSACCNSPVKRSPKLAGYKPYCIRCNKECEIKSS